MADSEKGIQLTDESCNVDTEQGQETKRLGLGPVESRDLEA